MPFGRRRRSPRTRWWAGTPNRRTTGCPPEPRPAARPAAIEATQHGSLMSPIRWRWPACCCHSTALSRELFRLSLEGSARVKVAMHVWPTTQSWRLAVPAANLIPPANAPTGNPTPTAPPHAPTSNSDLPENFLTVNSRQLHVPLQSRWETFVCF